MGGGLINFPTRFLRWVKIDGDTSCDDGGGDGGDSTPTKVYIKFKAEDFGLRDSDHVPDTIDRSKGYTLDEIFDMSGNMLEEFIKAQEDTRDNLVSNGYDIVSIGKVMGINLDDDQVIYNHYVFKYYSYESGNFGSMLGSYPIICLGFVKYNNNDISYTAKTTIKIEGSNLNGTSGTVTFIDFEKNDEDEKWYITDAS